MSYIKNFNDFKNNELNETSVDSILYANLNEAEGDWSIPDKQSLQKMVDQINLAIDKRNAATLVENPNTEGSKLPIPVKARLLPTTFNSTDIGGVYAKRPVYKISIKGIDSKATAVLGVFDTTKFFEQGSNENDNRPESWEKWKKQWTQLMLNPTYISDNLVASDKSAMGNRMASNYKRWGQPIKQYKAMAEELVRTISPIVLPAYESWFAQRSKGTVNQTGE